MSPRIRLKDLVLLMIGDKAVDRIKLVYGTFILSRALGRKTRISDVKRVINRMLKEGLLLSAGMKKTEEV